MSYMYYRMSYRGLPVLVLLSYAVCRYHKRGSCGTSTRSTILPVVLSTCSIQDRRSLQLFNPEVTLDGTPVQVQEQVQVQVVCA